MAKFFENTQPTEETLSALKYHQLKEVFTELGIADVWKQGRKGKDMIKEALEKLEALKEKVVESTSDVEEIIEEGKSEGQEGSEQAGEEEIIEESQEGASDEEEIKAQNPVENPDPNVIPKGEFPKVKALEKAEKKEEVVKEEMSEEARQAKITYHRERLENAEKNLWNAIPSLRVELQLSKQKHIKALLELGVDYENEK